MAMKISNAFLSLYIKIYFDLTAYPIHIAPSKMNHIHSRKYLPSALALGIAAIFSAAAAPAFAADEVKRLLDLQLKKGIITQQEYDEFMQASVGGNAQPGAAKSLEPQANNDARPRKKVTQSADSSPTGTVLIDNDNLKVEVFGTVDLAVGYTSKSLVPSGEMPTTIGPWISGGVKAPTAQAANLKSQTGIFNGALSASSWGIKASRDIGPEGMKAFILLDSAFNPATGQLIDQAHNQASNAKYPLTTYATSSLNGQLFGREAYVGMSGNEWGRITVGRNNNLILDVLNKYGPLQKAALFTPYGNGVMGGGGSISENGRVDNSIKYQNRIGNINIGLMYGLGGSGGLKHGAEGTTGNIGYENDRFGIQFVYEQFKDLLKTSPDTSNPVVANSLDLTAYNQQAALLAMKYKLNDRTRIQLGTQRTRLTNPSGDENISHISSIYGEAVTKSSAYNGQAVLMNIAHAGIDYDISDKLYVGAAYYYIDMPKYDYVSANTTKHYLGGALECLSFLTVYKLYANTDLYGGLLFSHYSGPAFASNNTTTYAHAITTAATGIRFKF